MQNIFAFAWEFRMDILRSEHEEHNTGRIFSRLGHDPDPDVCHRVYDN